MNLTSDAWIPVVWKDGSAGSVSLNDSFERGPEIRDLAVRPHERIAVMRLLICIAQAALDGPADYGEWKESEPKIAPAVVRYLRDWKSKFELLGEGPRFLQFPGLSRANGNSAESDDEQDDILVSKLDISLATGNNSTLFDHAGGTERAIAPARLALIMLAFQCFSPGGRIGVARLGGSHTPGEGSSLHAPCLADGMLHTLLRADHLIAAVHRNLLHKEHARRLLGRDDAWGRPVWELMPNSAGDGHAVTNATTTYLGRLAPLARAIRLAQNCSSMIMANGLEYPNLGDGWREPMATVIVKRAKNQTEERALFRASTDKAVWRELHALTVKSVAEGVGGPAALENVSGDSAAFDLWVGGLVTSKAKLVDTTESVFHLPANMLADEGQRVYEAGVKDAERAELRLMRAVAVYHKELGDDLDRREAKSRRTEIQRKARGQFWTDVELAVPVLLELAADPTPLAAGVWAETAWGANVSRAARSCYQRVCPQGTPRQIRAFALGQQMLFGNISKASVGEVDG
jgi:CRISPR system Cascade subunit CasA